MADDGDGGVVGLCGHCGWNFDCESVVTRFDRRCLLRADTVFAADDEGIAVAIRLIRDGGFFTRHVDLFIG